MLAYLALIRLYKLNIAKIKSLKQAEGCFMMLKRMKKVTFVLLATVVLVVPVATLAAPFLGFGNIVPTNGNWSNWRTVSGQGCNPTCMTVSGRVRGRVNSLSTIAEAESHNIGAVTVVSTQSRVGARNLTGITWNSTWRGAHSITSQSRNGTTLPSSEIQIRPVFPR